MAYAFRNILSRFVLVLGVLALLTTIVWAQAGTGELTGLVADPSGAVVPNAQVTLTNSATGDKRTTVTTAAGVYRFSALPIVGTYTLEVAPKGFKAVKIANLVMSVGTTVTQDVKLELGTGSEQVTVEAGAEVVQTSEAALSQLVDRRIWQQMPLQVRNQNSFIELVAGAVPQDGTNSWHGSAFEYNRIQALTANDWFSNNATPKIEDHLVRNQFGGSLGGPIVKDKSFWYGVGEIHRVRQSYPLTGTSTTQQFLDFVQSGGLETWAETDPNGVCVQVGGTPCPGALPLSSTIGPIFSKLRSNPALPYPLATSGFTNTANGVWTAGLTYPVPVYGSVVVNDPTSQDEARFSVKFDQK